jgi:hypothetical protein
MKTHGAHLLRSVVICAIGTAIPLALCAAGVGYLLVCFGAGDNGTVGPATPRDWVRFVGGGACLGALAGLILGAVAGLVGGTLYGATRRVREPGT